MLTIDEQLCTGCGRCVKICPEGFELINDRSIVKDSDAPCIKEAISACPSNAIIYDEDDRIDLSIGKRAFDRIQGIFTGIKDTRTKGRGMSTARGRGPGRGRGRCPGYGRGRGRGRRGR